MKALTIEELKQFGKYEFLYISVISDNLYRKDIFSGYYMLIQKDCYTINFQTTNNFINLWYSDYGKTWLAYRNKEEAECKGELVELICKVGDTIYIPWEFDGVSDVAKSEVVYIEVNKWDNKYVTNLCLTADTTSPKGLRYFQYMHHGVYCEEDFNQVWFKDENLAEQKLKELKEYD